MKENILKLPYNQWNERIKLDYKFEPKVDSAFLHHILPILAATPLIRKGKVSVNETIKHLKSMESISTPNGDIPASEVLGLIGFLYRCPRSRLMGSMLKEPTLGSLTPLWMYAHKLYNNIPYEDWSKTDLAIQYALGKYLEPILQYNKSKKYDNVDKRKSDTYIPQPTIPPIKSEDLVTYRKLALTPIKGGDPASLTSNKMNLKNINNRTYPKVTLQLLLQTWIANIDKRVPEAMILDPLNWDNVPPALDEGEQFIPPPKPVEPEDGLDEWGYVTDLL